MSTQHWMLQESPAYKVAHQGVSALSDRELLLSLISKPDAAQNLLTHYSSLADIARASATELTQVEGVSAYMAYQLVCCFELARRKRLDRNQRFQVRGSASAATYLTPLLVDESQEVFYVLFLNRRHDIIAEKALFRGGVSATVVDPK
ncbi:MAG: JAB domain-containing protein, partial [Bacteroidota bacterium]